MLYEKTLVTDDVPVHTKLIDMSKVLDIVYRNSLKEKFKCTMDDSNFFLLELSLNRRDVKARVGAIMTAEIQGYGSQMTVFCQ